MTQRNQTTLKRSVILIAFLHIFIIHIGTGEIVNPICKLKSKANPVFSDFCLDIGQLFNIIIAAENKVHQVKQEKAQAAIEGLLKLADLYSGIAAQSRISVEATDKYSTFFRQTPFLICLPTFYENPLWPRFVANPPLGKSGEGHHSFV